MPEGNSAAVADTNSAATQDTAGVSNPSSSAHNSSSNVSEDAKTQAKDGEASDDGAKKNPAEQEKDLPFHEHPAWQRQLRRAERAESTNKELKALFSDLLNKVEEVRAGQKGEEFKPVDVADDDLDFDTILDNEVEGLSNKLSREGKSLSPSEEREVIAIAQKYSSEIDGKKVPLPADTAYQIFLDTKGRSAESKDVAPQDKSEDKSEDNAKQKPSTRQSSAGASTESKAGSFSLNAETRRNMSLDDIIARAKARI